MKLHFLILIVVSLNTLSLANSAETQSGDLPQTCLDQAKVICPTEETPGGKIKCLFINLEKLDESCRQEIKRFARAVEQSNEQTGEVIVTPSALSSMTPPFTMVLMESRHLPGDNSMSDSRMNISTPFMQSKGSSFTASASAGQTHIDKSIQLGKGTQIPHNLDRAEVGLQYSQMLPGYRNWSLKGSVGYAGDKLFHNAKDTAFNFMGTYGQPAADGKGLWLWTLFFSNNSPIGNFIPIPGVMYIVRSPTFTGMYGFPMLSLQWTPAKDRAYSFSVLGLSATLEAAYGDILNAQFFAAMKWTSQNYILSQRKNDKDRLTSEEKRIGVGVRKFMFNRMSLDLEIGYAFDRVVYSGTGLRNFEDGSANFDDGYYGSASLKAGF